MTRNGARLLAFVAAFVLLLGQAQAQQREILVPGDVQLAIMIKTSLIAFNHANATGNYSVLRDLASPNFQQANTPARLGEIFQKQRGRHIDISPIVVLQPTLSRPAWVDEHGLLRLEGFFPSRPEQVNFTLAFEVVAGRWRLFGLGVHTAEPKTAAAAGQEGLAAVADKGGDRGLTVKAKLAKRPARRVTD